MGQQILDQQSLHQQLFTKPGGSRWTWGRPCTDRMLAPTVARSMTDRDLHSATSIKPLRIAVRWNLGRARRCCGPVHSITALTMILKLKAKGAGASVISREMALDIAEAVDSPSVASHLPGVANLTADTLSRFDERNPSLPPHLHGVPRARLGVRDHHWWRSLRRPSAAPGGVSFGKCCLCN